MPIPIQIDNQPIAAAFFGKGDWLTDYVTPDALEIQELHGNLTAGALNLQDKLAALHRWVGNEVKYVNFVRAKLWVSGKSSTQNDYWQKPSEVVRTRIGNCANKAFLLASLVRNNLPAEQVHVILGNLHQAPSPGGHAWVQCTLNGEEYIMESTRGDMKPLVVAKVADIYEDVVHFNDREVSAIEERTLLQPFTAVYADWLRDYLDWAFIEGKK